MAPAYQLPGLRRQRYEKLQLADLCYEIKQTTNGFDKLLSRGMYAIAFVQKVSRRNRLSSRVLCITTEFTFLCLFDASVTRVYRNRDIEQVLLQRRSDGWLAAISPRALSGDPCLLLALRRDNRSRPIPDPLEPLRVLQWLRAPFCKDAVVIREIQPDARPLEELTTEIIRQNWGGKAFAKPPGYMDQRWLRDKAAKWGQGSEVRYDITLTRPGEPLGITYGKHPYRDGKVVVIAVAENSPAAKALPIPIAVGAVIASVDSIEVVGEDGLRRAVGQIKAEQRTHFPIMCEQKIVSDAAPQSAFAHSGRDTFEETGEGESPKEATSPVFFDSTDGEGVQVTRGDRGVRTLDIYIDKAKIATVNCLRWEPSTAALWGKDVRIARVPEDGRSSTLRALIDLAEALEVPHSLPSPEEEALWRAQQEDAVRAEVAAALQQERDALQAEEERLQQKAFEERQAAQAAREAEAEAQAERFALEQARMDLFADWQRRDREEEVRALEAELGRLEAFSAVGLRSRDAYATEDALREREDRLAEAERELAEREAAAEEAQRMLLGLVAEGEVTQQSAISPEAEAGRCRGPVRTPPRPEPGQSHAPPLLVGSPGAPAPVKQPVRLWLPPNSNQEQAVFAHPRI
eukprot:Hpha_TRINITY_DN23415_c0_g1::TRINITY_DN23415_c0_g1_i1::g.113998::m.113998